MIDAFGHSEANAALFHDFGFEALFFSRMYEPMREIFKKKKKMTFVWQTDYKNHGPEKPLLTHVFPKNYAWPDEFRYEEKYNEDAPLVTDPNSLDYNLDSKCDALLNHSQIVVD